MDEQVQEGNLYDLLENVAQFYERQLPIAKKRKIISNTVAYQLKPFNSGV